MPQALVNGFVQGLLYAVLAVAFSLVHSTTRVFYFALAATYSLAPYVLWALIRCGVPWPIGATVAVLIGAALGIASEEWVHWPLERKRAPLEVHLIASLGVFLVVSQVIVLIWGNDPKALRAGLDPVFRFAGLSLAFGQFVEVVVSALALLGFFALLNWSAVGLELRSMASNPVLLSVLGRDIRNLRRAVFATSGGLASLAALAMARDVGFEPGVGMRTILIAVAATVVGGRASLAGAAAAGLLLGVVRAQVVWHASARWEDAATFLLLAAFLLLLPGGLHGLFGHRHARPEDAT
jgi:branched-chain amino acid transport system permease protein